MRRGNRRRQLLANLALLGAALVVTLGALEIGVRVLVDFREQAPIPVYDIDPSKPIAFLPQRERVYETPEFRYTFSFNRFGRRDVEWSPEVIADPGNLLFVGDSFVLGNGVEDRDAIPTLLEARFARRGRPREVFNFGMPASGPPRYLELLQEALDQGIAARQVLLGLFIGNDFYPSVLPERSPRATPPPAEARRPALPRSQLARLLRLRVARSPRAVGWALGLSGMLGISLYDTAGSYIFLRRPTPEQNALFDDILDYVARMKRLCDENQRQLSLVIFPNKIQVENHEALTSAVMDAGRPNRRIVEFCEEQGLACLDLLPVLRGAWIEERERLYFPVDRHLNPTGTHLAADTIAGFLGAKP